MGILYVDSRSLMDFLLVGWSCGSIHTGQPCEPGKDEWVQAGGSQNSYAESTLAGQLKLKWSGVGGSLWDGPNCGRHGLGVPRTLYTGGTLMAGSKDDFGQVVLEHSVPGVP